MAVAVEEVGRGVFVVEASGSNVAVVVDGSDVTLVDTGYPADRELLEAAVERVGRRLSDVAAVLLTHAHVDHRGSAEWLRERLGAPVHCHAAEAPLARGERVEMISEADLALRIWRPSVLMFTVKALRRGARRTAHVTEVLGFEADGTLDVPGRPHAVHTPGHTSGHAAFHLPDRGVLLCGDALITVDVWNASRRGPQVIRDVFNHDHEQAIRSLARLEGLAADVVVPGHGPPFHGTPAAAVAQARRRGDGRRIRR